MSTLDQPLLIATVNYHVGHTLSIRVAEEKGYFRAEGLSRYVFEGAGLLPAMFEREALGTTMAEHGVDVAAGAKVFAAIAQRAAGADLFIVGGWRIDGPAGTKWYARPEIRTPADLRGRRVGIRERGSMNEEFLTTALRLAGVDGRREIEWVCDPIFYAGRSEEFDALRSGRVDLIPVRPAQFAEAEREGLTLVVDTTALFPAGRPGKVIVATGRTIERRTEELRSFLRANIRAFWYCRNAENFEALSALDARLRIDSHNDHEHRHRLVSSPDMMGAWPMPLDGAIPRDQFASMIEDFNARGETARPLAVDDVLRDEHAVAAYEELCARGEYGADFARNAALKAAHRY